MIPAKLPQLLFPLVPELREPMQEQHQPPVARGHTMQPQAVRGDVLLAKLKRIHHARKGMPRPAKKATRPRKRQTDAAYSSLTANRSAQNHIPTSSPLVQFSVILGP